MAPMSNRLLVPRKTPGLLDLVPGAAAAYSLRSLSNSYADPVVTVRRSSDDAEEDFTASEVADGTLAAFCGAGDGFVYRWWDQSGNARHAVAAADANEPKIVDSGVVVTEEGKPAIQFDGSDDYLQLSSAVAIGTSADARFFGAALFAPDATDIDGYVWHSTTGAAGSAGTDNGLLVQSSAYTWGTGTSSDAVAWLTYGSVQTVHSLHTVTLAAETSSTGSKSAYINGGIAATGLYAVKVSAAVTTRIGSRADTLSQFFAGNMQEILLYNADLSSQRELIEGNIAWSYS